MSIWSTSERLFAEVYQNPSKEEQDEVPVPDLRQRE